MALLRGCEPCCPCSGLLRLCVRAACCGIPCVYCVCGMYTRFFLCHSVCVVCVGCTHCVLCAWDVQVAAIVARTEESRLGLTKSVLQDDDLELKVQVRISR